MYREEEWYARKSFKASVDFSIRLLLKYIPIQVEKIGKNNTNL